MAKALVLECRGGVATVLVKGQFRRVPVRGPVAPGEEIELSLPTARRFLRLPALAAAAAVLVGALVLTRQTPAAYAKTVAYVAVDVNPTFTLGLDAQGRVTSVKPADPSALHIAGQVHLAGQSLAAAVKSIVALSLKDHYAGGAKAATVIMVAYPPDSQKAIPPGDTKAVADAQTAAQRQLQSAKIPSQVVAFSADQKALAAAKKAGAPLTRYEVWSHLGAGGVKLDLKKLAHQDVGQVLAAPKAQKILKKFASPIADESGPGGQQARGRPQGGGGGKGAGQGDRSGKGSGQGGGGQRDHGQGSQKGSGSGPFPLLGFLHLGGSGNRGHGPAPGQGQSHGQSQGQGRRQGRGSGHGGSPAPGAGQGRSDSGQSHRGGAQNQTGPRQGQGYGQGSAGGGNQGRGTGGQAHGHPQGGQGRGSQGQDQAGHRGDTGQGQGG